MINTIMRGALANIKETNVLKNIHFLKNTYIFEFYYIIYIYESYVRTHYCNIFLNELLIVHMIYLFMLPFNIYLCVYL